MLDRTEAHGDRNPGQDLPSHAATPVADRPLADREVPLTGTVAADDGSALMIHQWLDGEASEADARRADAKQVDLWKMISVETEQRRRVTTPASLAANIMAAIPDARTTTAAVTAAATSVSATVEPKATTPMTLMLIVATGMLAFGIMIGTAIGKML